MMWFNLNLGLNFIFLCVWVGLCRDVQCTCSYKGKDKQAFLLVKPTFLLNCICKIPPCLCFPFQFDLVVSFISVCDINRQQALSGISVHVRVHLCTRMNDNEFEPKKNNI